MLFSRSLLLLALLAFASPAQAARQVSCVALLSPQWDVGMQKEFARASAQWYSTKNFFDFKDDSGFPSPVNENGHVLGTLLESGKDPHTATLASLGYTIARDPYGRPVLQPPALARDLFRNYNTAVDAHVAVGTISADDRIRFALIFVKNSVEDELSSEWSDYLFIDPATDPWPSKAQYKLATKVTGNLQLPAPIWYQAMALGLIPFPTANFLDHEMAHVTEFLQFPLLMKETRAFYRRAQGQLPADNLGRRLSPSASFFRCLM